MERVEDRTMKLSCLPLFPHTLEIAKSAIPTLPPHDCYWVYTDISNGRITLSFLSSTNKSCTSKAEMSYLRKVEMSPTLLGLNNLEG